MLGEVLWATSDFLVGKFRQVRVEGPDELPSRYENITSSWLTAILCQSVPGAEVTSYRLDEEDPGTSNRRRIFLEYNAAGADANLPASVFCKATMGLFNRMALGLTRGIHNEVIFFNQMRPRLDIETPRSLFASYDPRTLNSFIALEDLGGRVEFCQTSTRLDRPKAESLVEVLARLHGHYYENEELVTARSQMKTWRNYFYDNARSLQLEKYTDKGFGAAQSVIPPGLFARRKEVWPATVESVDLHDSLPNTFIHSDVHIKNWYLADNDVMGLTDWQCCCVGHWSRDFAYAISTCLAVEDRRRWERDLLKHYLDVLHEVSGQKVAFEEAWNYYRQQLMTALAWWTVTFTPPWYMPEMQPGETSLELIRRISTAMDDLDSLSSFS